MLKLIVRFLFIFKVIQSNLIESPLLQQPKRHNHKYNQQLNRQTNAHGASSFYQHHHFLTKKQTSSKQLKQKNVNSPLPFIQRQNLIEENSLADVRQVDKERQAIDPQIFQKIKKVSNKQQVTLKGGNFQEKEYSNQQKIKSELRLQQVININDLTKGKMQLNQGKNQVVSPQEKTLYFTLVEAVDKFLKLFSRSNQPIQYHATTNKIDKTSPKNEITNYNLAQIKPVEIQIPSSITKKMQKEHSDDLLSATVQTIDPQKNNKLMKDTQVLAKKRKKLYFIICTLSFGGICIFLIKLLQQKNEKAKNEREEIIKVPQEFYIQQI